MFSLWKEEVTKTLAIVQLPSGTHLSLLVKLLLKPMNQLPVISIELPIVSANRVAGEKNKHNLFFQVPTRTFLFPWPYPYGSTQTYLKTKYLQLTILIFCLKASSCSASKQAGQALLMSHLTLRNVLQNAMAGNLVCWQLYCHYYALSVGPQPSTGLCH